jgi:small subunit ribosomal protein S6
MKRYETIYIVNPNLDAESLSEVIVKFSGLVEKLKGSLFKVQEWGKRKLAYEVKRFDKGYYIMLGFFGLPDTVKELERNLKLDDRILKYLTVKIDEDVNLDEVIDKEVKNKKEKEEEIQDQSTEEE